MRHTCVYNVEHASDVGATIVSTVAKTCSSSRRTIRARDDSPAAIAAAFERSSLACLLVPDEATAAAIRAHTARPVVATVTEAEACAWPAHCPGNSRHVRAVAPLLLTSPARPPDLTLACADCVAPGLAARAMTRSLPGLSVRRAVLLSDDLPVDLPASIDWQWIARLDSRDAYNLFVLRDLHRYVDTSHVLTIQTDGYVLDAGRWQPEWLEYDYIGAPTADLSGRLMNSGFCVRSQRLLAATAQLATSAAIGLHRRRWARVLDDAFATIDHRQALAAAGLRFAPPDQAVRFAVETVGTWGETFGFHGRQRPETRAMCESLRSVG